MGRKLFIIALIIVGLAIFSAVFLKYEIEYSFYNDIKPLAEKISNAAVEQIRIDSTFTKLDEITNTYYKRYPELVMIAYRDSSNTLQFFNNNVNIPFSIRGYQDFYPKMDKNYYHFTNFEDTSSDNIKTSMALYSVPYNEGKNEIGIIDIGFNSSQINEAISGINIFVFCFAVSLLLISIFFILVIKFWRADKEVTNSQLNNHLIKPNSNNNKQRSIPKALLQYEPMINGKNIISVSKPLSINTVISKQVTNNEITANKEKNNTNNKTNKKAVSISLNQNFLHATKRKQSEFLSQGK